MTVYSILANIETEPTAIEWWHLVLVLVVAGILFYLGTNRSGNYRSMNRRARNAQSRAAGRNVHGTPSTPGEPQRQADARSRRVSGLDKALTPSRERRTRERNKKKGR